MSPTIPKQAKTLPRLQIIVLATTAEQSKNLLSFTDCVVLERGLLDSLPTDKFSMKKLPSYWMIAMISSASLIFIAVNRDSGIKM